eukprot:TRINITY_DN190_c0_g1_i1.p1 TRINITY_DN190_c0_g1~~TRINITY_DN190_c0_g1_i1.p1  ORF type:complete len:248 (-),score=46.12 TRINITY_DN190_c0_g1_i1:173-916(-)
MTMTRVSLALLCVVALVSEALAGCGTHKASDGSTYNLDPLTLSGGEYSGPEYVNPTLSYTYRWNFCAPVKTQCGSFSGARVTQTGDQNGACLPCGYDPVSISNHPDGPSKGVQLTYINGLDSKCQNGEISRTTNIIVGCGTSDWTLGAISEPEGSKCLYQIKGTSKHACPLPGTGGSGKLSGGSIFLIIFFSAFTLYFLVGAVVSWKVKGNSGIEIIPNFEFWKDLPFLMKDGVFFIRYKVTGYKPI